MAGQVDQPAAPRQLPRWALPGELAAAAGGAPGRTARDWLVDALLFLFAALWWLWSWDDYVFNPDPGYVAVVEPWMITVDPWVGAAGCVALWWRRRFPLGLAIATVAALTISSMVTGALLVALFTLAVHRSWLPSTLVAAVAVAQALWFSLVYTPPGMPQAVFMIYAALMFALPLGWGLMVRFRRQLLVSLHRAARHERDEHAGRLEAARRTERARIAHEMHDVLAHRISLLSVHAGALAYRTSQAEAGQGAALSATEVAGAVTVIRDNAHLALTELGDVLAVLRAGAPPESGQPDHRSPPPALADLSRLVDEARAAGQRVTLTVAEQVTGAPTQVQRTAYRVVQEGLTNARKHAPDAQVSVEVDGGAGHGVRVSVANPLPVGVTALEIPGAGAGLTGLSERVLLDGGTLEHGAADGRFRLCVQLPWHA